MKNIQNPEVSILVPVYNVSKYLRQCLESIVAQTFTDWECVIVDDGSTDGSEIICDEFATKDPRFRVLHVKNGGIASTRNIGVKEAKGNFIAFCDSDDWFEPTAIAKMYELMTTYDADIVQTGFIKEYKGYSKVKHLVDKTLVLNREEAISELAKDKKIPSYMWNKMYRRNIVGCDFPVGKTFEDQYACTKWFPKIKKMICDPTPLYHYRMRKGSILHCGSSKYRLEFLEAASFRANEFLKLGLPTFTSKENDILMATAKVKSAKKIAREEKDKENRIRILNEIRDSNQIQKTPDIKDLGLKVWLRYNFLIHSPKFFSALMRLTGKTNINPHHHNHKFFD